MERAVPHITPFRPTARRPMYGNRRRLSGRGPRLAAPFQSPRKAHCERNGRYAYLAGGFAAGWEAPPLTRCRRRRSAWSADELFAYLRFGESAFTLVAAGPCAFLKDWAALAPTRTPCHGVYLASFNATARRSSGPRREARSPATSRASARQRGARLYPGAVPRMPRSRRARRVLQPPSLALNATFHAHPTTGFQVSLHGIASTPRPTAAIGRLQDSFKPTASLPNASYLRRQICSRQSA